MTRKRIPVQARYGRAKVVGENPEPFQSKQREVLCRCDCGAYFWTRFSSLHAGFTRSCGCLAREELGSRKYLHGGSRTRTYQLWDAMRARVEGRKGKNPRYVQRGITLDPRWNSFENFLADMGECPEGLSLDRIDNNGNYEPGNCRWATWKQQANNRSTNRLWDGQKVILSDVASQTGIKEATLRTRVFRGMSLKEAIETPVTQRNRLPSKKK